MPDAAQPAYLHLDAATRRVRLDPHEPAFVQDPYPAYAFLHARAPVFFWQEYGFWCVSGFAEVNRLLRDRRFGREKPGGYHAFMRSRDERSHLAAFDAVEARSLLELEPPDHTRLRRLVNRAFVSRQIERLAPRIEALAHELIDAFEGDREADLIAAFASPLPVQVIADMLGVPREAAPQLLDWSHRMVAMYMHGCDRAAEDSANRAAGEFAAFIRAQAKARRGAPGDDLLGVLVAAQAEGETIDEDELVSSAILLLNAGHEATVHQTGNAVRTVLAEGGDPRRFFTDSNACAATVEECLRIDAPLHMFTRYAGEPAEITDGVTIGEGETVGLLLGAANRDPTAFSAPHSFQPGRGDQKSVSFGAGIHFCVGAPLARLEMQIALKVLFERLPELHLAETPVYRDSYHFHGLERLVCRW